MGGLWSSDTDKQSCMTSPFIADVDSDDALEILKHHLPEGDIQAYEFPDRNPQLDQQATDDNACASCSELASVHIILPCRHRCICNRCILDIVSSGMGKCILCKTGIEQIL